MNQGHFWKRMSQSNRFYFEGRFNEAADCLKDVIESLRAEERRPRFYLERAERYKIIAESTIEPDGRAGKRSNDLFVRALTDYAEVRARGAESFKSLFEMGQCYFVLGFYQEGNSALDEAEKHAETSGQLFEIFFHRSKAALVEKEYGDCVHFTRTALSKPEGHPHQRALLFFMRARALDETGHFKQGLISIEEARKICPRNKEFQELRKKLLAEIFSLQSCQTIRV